MRPVQLREAIDSIFEGKAFVRPLFYGYPGGLRFELSEGRGAIEQFLSGLRKAQQICADVFGKGMPVVVCLRVYHCGSAFSHRPMLRELQGADIHVPRTRCLWAEPIPTEHRHRDDGRQEWFLNLAFEAQPSQLDNLLWCALSRDFPAIRPRPECDVYLFNLQDKVMVLPYDSRGMDIVGPNHALLEKLYERHRQHLLPYDLETMKATFAS